MKITYIHHSSFLVELESVYLLFDYTEGVILRAEAGKAASGIGKPQARGPLFTGDI